MLRYILPLIPEHKIYTEAFFGGGAVFWAKEPAKVEFINDHNGEVINFVNIFPIFATLASINFKVCCKTHKKNIPNI
jgi:hypothetical protein